MTGASNSAKIVTPDIVACKVITNSAKVHLQRNLSRAEHSNLGMAVHGKLTVSTGLAHDHLIHPIPSSLHMRSSP